MLAWLCVSLGQGADLHMAKLMPLPSLYISCKVRIERAAFATKAKNAKVIWEDPHRHPHLMAENNYATKSSLVTVGCPTFSLPPKLPLHFDDLHTHLMHPSLERHHSPPQMASRSNQPFFTIHPLDRPTDRPTDRRASRQACTNSTHTLYWLHSSVSVSRQVSLMRHFVLLRALHSLIM